jgi:hypothetical protein
MFVQSRTATGETTMAEILKGHLSPETAYLVRDYPYGYTLRCQIRYWLEFKLGKGVRFVSQTTNPKRPGTVWNKPKASTYARWAGCMYLNEKGHCTWTGLSEYSNGQEAAAWASAWREGVPPAALEGLDAWVRGKLAYDAARAANREAADKDLSVGLDEAFRAMAKGNSAIE